ncbi:MAG TPA: hypothetical protein PKH07_16870, partial [bacterium]|nr:hypothetical protein [bacterium]
MRIRITSLISALIVGLCLFTPLAWSQNDQMRISAEADFRISGTTFADHEIAGTDLSGNWSNQLAAMTSLLPSQVGIDALDITSETEVYLSLDVDTQIGGTLYANEDVLRWDGVGLTMTWDGTANGLPTRANLSALHVISDSPWEMAFSLSATTQLSGLGLVRPSDAVHYVEGSGFVGFFFQGQSAGLPAGVKVDMFQIWTADHYLISFDCAVRPTGHVTTYRSADILSWDPDSGTLSASPFFSADAQSLPARIDINAAVA